MLTDKNSATKLLLKDTFSKETFKFPKGKTKVWNTNPRYMRGSREGFSFLQHYYSSTKKWMVEKSSELELLYVSESLGNSRKKINASQTINRGGKTRSKHFPDVNKQNHQRMCKHIVATHKRTQDTTRFPHISTRMTDPGDGDTRKDTKTTTTTKTKSDLVFRAEDLQIERRKKRAERKETILSSPPLHPRRQNITKHKVLVTNLLTTRSSKSSWTRNRRKQKARGKQETEKKLPAGSIDKQASAPSSSSSSSSSPVRAHLRRSSNEINLEKQGFGVWLRATK